MARDYSPPESPLTSVDSSEGYDEDGHDYDDSLLRPSKRQKVGAGSVASSAAVADPEPEPEHEADALEGLSDVSSDTEGDIPSSPFNTRADDDDFQDQVSVCAWEDCEAGDLGNMDKLVAHIHNDHIETRQKKYTCEWVDCSRKGMPHASGYALKAHMRSHTREKPFYCYLPECDRSFTRSDALAKHMRTVHETEALRPSDPVPKSMQLHPSSAKTSKLKIIIKTPQSHAAGQEDSVEGESNGEDVGDFTAMTDDQFTTAELAMPLEKLHRLCRAQVKWAEAEGERLQKECKMWEELYNEESLQKNALLAQVIEGEVDWHERRGAIISGAVDIQLGKADTSAVEHTNGVGEDAGSAEDRPTINGQHAVEAVTE